MISASPRYAWPVVALALLAAVPVWIHVIQRPVHDPCASPTQLAILSRLGGMTVTARKVPDGAPPGAFVLGGSVAELPGGVDDLRFRFERSFDPATAYGLAAVRKFGSAIFFDMPVDRIDLDTEIGPIPVYWIEGTHERIFRLRAHAFVLDGQAISSPFLAGLRLALPQLLGGTQPITVLAVRAEGAAARAGAMRDLAQGWLRDAWVESTRICGG